MFSFNVHVLYGLVGWMRVGGERWDRIMKIKIHILDLKDILSLTPKRSGKSYDEEV